MMDLLKDGNNGTRLPGAGRAVMDQLVKFPGPLMRNKLQKKNLTCYIAQQAEECLQLIPEQNQVEEYFFWQIMELFCQRNGNVEMHDVATLLMNCYHLLKMKLTVDQKDWCMSLVQLLFSSAPHNKLIDAVMKLGDDFASRGLTYAAHICYMVAKANLGSRRHFQLIGCYSVPFGLISLNEALARTETYEYVLSLTSGLAQPGFQVFKLCHAGRLAQFGNLEDARNYCETIALAAIAFPDSFNRSFFERLLWFAYYVHEGKPEEPEWLRELRQLRNIKLTDAEIQHAEFYTMTEEIPAPQSPCVKWYNDPAVFAWRYAMGRMLGRGCFGSVRAGIQNEDGRKVAIKFVSKRNYIRFMMVPGEMYKLPVEVVLMRMVSEEPCSSNVVELLDWFDMPDYIILVQERPSPCMDLNAFVNLHNGSLSEAQTRLIMKQVVQAARHCAAHGVIHRDIKVDNLLINTDTLQVKLTDFGCAELLMDTPQDSFIGSIVLIPPEVVFCRTYMGIPATVWGLGILLYKLLCGHYPFNTDSDFYFGQLNLCPDMSQECFDLLMWCLEFNFEMRPGFEDILVHEWFKPESRFQSEDTVEQMTVN